MSLGDDVRAYVTRKFGEHEAGYLMLKHDSLRHVIADFAIGWINTREETEQQAELDWFVDLLETLKRGQTNDMKDAIAAVESAIRVKRKKLRD